MFGLFAIIMTARDVREAYLNEPMGIEGMAQTPVTPQQFRDSALEILRKGIPEIGFSLPEEDIQAIDKAFPVEPGEIGHSDV